MSPFSCSVVRQFIDEVTTAVYYIQLGESSLMSRHVYNLEMLSIVSKEGKAGRICRKATRKFFVRKNCTLVGEEFIGDAIVCENLEEYMVVAVQGFLRVEPSASDGVSGIVNQMEVSDLAGHPFIGRGIPLLQFTEISASGAPGMGIFDCD